MQARRPLELQRPRCQCPLPPLARARPPSAWRYPRTAASPFPTAAALRARAFRVKRRPHGPAMALCPKPGRHWGFWPGRRPVFSPLPVAWEQPGGGHRKTKRNGVNSSAALFLVGFVFFTILARSLFFSLRGFCFCLCLVSPSTTVGDIPSD